ncbi:hypothetical protein C8Q77DRAFT_730058 [Trametes polyzona]|nr:hypothetical protein C8Q77DRAFT_730058 [Trametes polyzona]
MCTSVLAAEVIPCVPCVHSFQPPGSLVEPDCCLVQLISVIVLEPLRCEAHCGRAAGAHEGRCPRRSDAGVEAHKCAPKEVLRMSIIISVGVDNEADTMKLKRKQQHLPEDPSPGLSFWTGRRAGLYRYFEAVQIFVLPRRAEEATSCALEVYRIVTVVIHEGEQDIMVVRIESGGTRQDRFVFENTVGNSKPPSSHGLASVVR